MRAESSASAALDARLPGDASGCSTLVDVLQLRARAQERDLAYVFLADGRHRVSSIRYGELDRAARRIAVALGETAGVGDRALLLYPPGLDFISAFFGCLYAGVIAVPLYPPQGRHGEDRFAGVLADARPSALLTPSAFLSTTEKLLARLPGHDRKRVVCFPGGVEGDGAQWRQPDVTRESLALLQYTSGSTGDPKGVMVSHHNILSNEEMMRLAFGHTDERVSKLETASKSRAVGVSWLPTFHDLGLAGHVLQGLYLGKPNVFLPPSVFIHRPLAWLETISRYRAHSSGAPNFAYELCARRATPEDLAGLDLSCWQLAYSGAEPIHADTLDRFSRTFEPTGFRRDAFLACYGLAEATLLVTCGEFREPPTVRSFSPGDLGRGRLTPAAPEERAPKRLVSCGWPRGGTQVRIVEPGTGSPCAKGTIGEIWVAGPSVARGYWSDAEDRAGHFHARIRGEESATYLRTGDLGGVFDGELYVTGRLKDMIIVRGMNLHPQDLESAAARCHPDLELGAAAFAIAGDAGEGVVLVQEVRRGAQAEPEEILESIRVAVVAACGAELSDIVLVEPKAIPRTSSGKVRRTACREAYLKRALPIIASTERAAAERSGPDGSDVIVRTVQELLRRLGVSGRPELDSHLRDDLGLDSVRLVTLVTDLEQALEVAASPEQLIEIQTLGDLVRVMEKATPRGEGSAGGLSDLGDRLLERIPQLRVIVQEQSGRRLRVGDRWVDDFASANYLGLDLHPRLARAIEEAVERWGVHPSWTRIVASPRIYVDLERRIAEFIGAPHVLAFPTVTLLHAGVLPLLAGPGGAILLDEHAHSSIQAASQLARDAGTQVEIFSHGDLRSLEAGLERAAERERRILAVDGVYSMSSDYAQLPELCRLAKEHDADVYVDDAHGFGVIGERPSAARPYGHRGNGLVRYFDLDYADDRIVYVGGMSKAFSSLAAFVTCRSEEEKTRLCRASTLVFSGPCPTASLASAIAGIDISDSEEGEALRLKLLNLTRQLATGARELGFEVSNNRSFPLVGVVVGSLAALVRACDVLWEHGILITPAFFPAVPIDRGLLRFTLTAANQPEQVETALAALERVRGELF